MRILVTGATGFIGSHIVRELLRRGHEVRATRRASSRTDVVEDVIAEVDWIELDLVTASREELIGLADSVDACIHAAWYAEPGRYSRAPENVEWVCTSLRLLNALADADCSRAVYVGTCFEYDHRHGYLSEATPTLPWTLYGAAKLSTSLMGERLAQVRDIGFAWVRLFYQYGPHEDARRLVPQVIQALLRGEEAIVTRGDQVRDYLHVADVARAVADVTLSEEVGVVNVGSGRPVRVRDVVASIARATGSEDRVRFGARPDSPGDPPFICANNRRLLTELGWRPRYGLEEGLRETIEWWREKMAAPVADDLASRQPGA